MRRALALLLRELRGRARANLSTAVDLGEQVARLVRERDDALMQASAAAEREHAAAERAERVSARMEEEDGLCERLEGRVRELEAERSGLYQKLEKCYGELAALRELGRVVAPEDER
ncbi:hypothetical protein [Archangium sp. Cb G35]|uniref:hypothetical protein n=1 Tax=Archangium sp. Cb G35 TaxID=1920190 RepID=UPI0011611268|nr:hypothetical protein [Archangium sp. Cb G35]